jgi:hypothetical protein
LRRKEKKGEELWRKFDSTEGIRDCEEILRRKEKKRDDLWWRYDRTKRGRDCEEIWRRKEGNCGVSLIEQKEEEIVKKF